MTTGVRLDSQCLIKKNRIKSKNHSADEALGMKGKKKINCAFMCEAQATGLQVFQARRTDYTPHSTQRPELCGPQ